MHKFDWYVGRAVLMLTLAVLLLLVGLDAQGFADAAAGFFGLGDG